MYSQATVSSPPGREPCSYGTGSSEKEDAGNLRGSPSRTPPHGGEAERDTSSCPFWAGDSCCYLRDFGRVSVLVPGVNT